MKGLQTKSSCLAESNFLKDFVISFELKLYNRSRKKDGDLKFGFEHKMEVYGITLNLHNFFY